MNIKSAFVARQRELIVSSLIILACIILSIIFPVDRTNILQLFTRDLFFLVIIPMFYIKLVLRKDLASFGLTLGEKRTGLVGGLIAIIVIAAGYFFLLRYTSLSEKYSLPPNTIIKFYLFVFYELVLVNFYFIVQEFFYRGFVQFIFSKRFAYWAIVIQIVLFSLVSYINKSLYWQFGLPLALSLVNGVLAYRSKSIIYTYVVSIISTIIINAYVIYNLNQ